MGREAALCFRPVKPRAQVLRLLRSRSGINPLATEAKYARLLQPNTTNRFGNSFLTCVTGTCTFNNSPHASTHVTNPSSVRP